MDCCGLWSPDSVWSPDCVEMFSGFILGCWFEDFVLQEVQDEQRRGAFTDRALIGQKELSVDQLRLGCHEGMSPPAPPVSTHNTSALFQIDVTVFEAAQCSGGSYPQSSAVGDLSRCLTFS